jgi:hypothetical protein
MLPVLAAFLVLSAGASPDPKVCAAKGGTVRPVCISRAPMCVIPYSDAGKRCTDKSQCKGRCLTDTGPRPGKKKVEGRCEANNDPCGCFQTVEKGRLGSALCVD